MSNPANRFGEQTEPGTKKLKYTKRHINGIYGVAWEGDGSKNDLAKMNPESSRSKWPKTYILVNWDIEGKGVKTWETRQTIRARWGTKVADQSIFEAACEKERTGCRSVGVSFFRGLQSSRFQDSDLATLVVMSILGLIPFLLSTILLGGEALLRNVAILTLRARRLRPWTQILGPVIVSPSHGIVLIN